MGSLDEIFIRHGKVIDVPADETLIARGGSISRVYRLERGRVLVHSTSSWGRDIAYGVVRPGEFLGIGAFGSDQRAVFDATTLTDCALLAADRVAVQRDVVTDPEAAPAVFDVLVKMLRNRTRLAESLAAPTLEARLARWLISSFQEEGIEPSEGAAIPIEYSQGLIAAFSGSSRESVNRRLKKWEEANVISFSGRNLKLLDAVKLARLAGGVGDSDPA